MPTKSKSIAIILLVALLMSFPSKTSHGSSPRKSRSNNISFCAINSRGEYPDLITVGYKRHIFPSISIGINVAPFASNRGGGIELKYYYPAASSESFVLGFHHDIWYLSDEWLSMRTAITFGWEYLTPVGLNIFLAAGFYRGYLERCYICDTFGYHMSIGLGYSFKLL